MVDWLTYRGEGPWALIQQGNKFGYDNNPNFTSVATEKHNPCGHWHKGATTVTNTLTEDILLHLPFDGTDGDIEWSVEGLFQLDYSDYCELDTSIYYSGNSSLLFPPSYAEIAYYSDSVIGNDFIYETYFQYDGTSLAYRSSTNFDGFCPFYLSGSISWCMVEIYAKSDSLPYINCQVKGSDSSTRYNSLQLYTVIPNAWHKLRVVSFGRTITFALNDILLFTHTFSSDNCLSDLGYFMCWSYWINQNAWIDDISLTTNIHNEILMTTVTYTEPQFRSG